MTANASLTMTLTRPSVVDRRSSSTPTQVESSMSTQQPMEPLASAGTRSSHPPVVTEMADLLPISQIGAQSHGASLTKTSAPRRTLKNQHISQAKASTTVTVSAMPKTHSPTGTPTRRMTMEKPTTVPLQPQAERLEVKRLKVVP